MTNSDKDGAESIHNDAKGQYAKGLTHSDNNGVASAKPRVITGSDDATAHKAPPGQKQAGTEWDVNYAERESDKSAS